MDDELIESSIVAATAGAGVGGGIVLGQRLIGEADPDQPLLGAKLGGMAGVVMGVGVGMIVTGPPR